MSTTFETGTRELLKPLLQSYGKPQYQKPDGCAKNQPSLLEHGCRSRRERQPDLGRCLRAPDSVGWPKSDHHQSQKSIAQFRSREDMKIGTRDLARSEYVGLLGSPDPLGCATHQDFRGLSPKGFDKAGNFGGLAEQALFPEVSTARSQPRSQHHYRFRTLES